MKKFTDFLLDRDSLGQTYTIQYKGRTSYATLPGAMLSMIIKLLVITQLIRLSISLINMYDPKI